MKLESKNTIKTEYQKLQPQQTTRKATNGKNKSMETGAWHGTTYLPPSTLEAEADQLGNVL